MEKPQHTHNWFFILFLLIMLGFFGFVIFQEPALTGLIIHEEASYVKNWTFDSANDYVYDNSLVKVEDGAARVVSTTNYIYWNTTNEAIYTVNSALYDPSDKTEKVSAQDNQKHEAHDGKLFELFFPENLNNGDIISFYAKDGDQTSIYLCRAGSVCSPPEYGSVNYDG